MAERLSSGLRNFLLGRGSMRDFLESVSMKIYSGAAPALANDAVTGVLLVTITQASLTDQLEDQYGEIVTVTVTSHAAGETFGFNVTIGTETLVATRVYTNTPDVGGVELVAARLVKLFNEIGCKACASGINGIVYVMAPSRKSLTVALTAGMTGTVTVADAVLAAESTGDMLNFGPPSAGAMSKTSDVWSGVIATSGVAGYFRFVQVGDDGTLSTTQVRAQGGISTSGAELNLSNTSLVALATLTIDTYSISLPAE